MPSLPRIALTLGDVAGVGPEVVVRAWTEGQLCDSCRPVVVGHPEVVRRAVRMLKLTAEVAEVAEIDAGDPATGRILCWNPAGAGADAANVPPAKNDARAGRAAYECLVAATKAALAGKIDAITTAPLSKAALHLAGLDYPGHTEILAELCGVREFGMMLHLPAAERIQDSGFGIQGGGERSLSVVHVTLHTSIRSVPGLITTEGVQEKIGLIDSFLKDIGMERGRIGVCALNPHAGEEELFGDEEPRIIAPAVEDARRAGINVSGPWPADTLFKRGAEGEFDGIVAMYHDQGHIALKLLGFHRAVNITLGLPIVRTSPSQGTAFDIAWQGKASAEGMIGAVRVAAMLARKRVRSGGGA